MDYGMCSVIIPLYNVKEYLDDCLKSILEQTYINYEIILVDDGSTDGSAAICDNYSKNYKNIRVIHENNFGVSHARNVGLVNSFGKYILFVDPDDIVKRDFIDNRFFVNCSGLTYNHMRERTLVLSFLALCQL